ncbi:exodeoxyribonuclease V subunit gamma [Spiribacter halobius]|nr:exodeoxyribonuclease V subunit gamma [Spiribacter halobius]UEX79885.1 exodeoxyribonuclease V subunit gamma [Spiribacter halobius]
MVIHGNRLEDLRALAVEWLRRHPLAPLENEIFLVQSNGIAQWLKLALARAPEAPEGGCGIAAAVDVQLPARFLWSAYRGVLGADAVPAESPFAKEALTWRLMRLLPDLLHDPVFAPLQRFLSDDHDRRKRHQLALRLADLLDQYQVYRADWLSDWAEGRDVLRDARGHEAALAADHAWQPALWRAVLADLPASARQRSRAAVHEAFLRAAGELTARPPGLPRRVIVFGISSLPRQSLEALEALAGVSQVLLCVHNPCEHFWADIVPDRELLTGPRRRQARRPDMPADLSPEALHGHAHPLLAAWGKQGRDYIRLLDEHDDPERYRALFRTLSWQRIDLFEPHGEDCLLHQLQEDIRDLRPLSETRERWPAVPAEDDSIRFQIAHSPQREVEALHDRLLDCFSADPTLRPRDVIVMVPDVDRYAPHIEAVFGRLDPDDPRYIPFTVADRGRRGQAPLLIALEQLLRLPEARVAVSEVLDLLDVPALRRRFGLAEAALGRLHGWVEGAGVRWGLHARQRAALGLPDGFEQNSWAFGLRRMLLGYAVGEADPWQGIEPFAEVGGLEAAELGPLADLLETLDRWWQALAAEATPADWAVRLRALLDDCFHAAGEDDQLLLDRLLEALDDWESTCAEAGLEEPLPLAVVREHWLAAVDAPSLSRRFLAGAVNVCTLMPMRAIPFRVVCLLGMSDGDYPRSPQPVDFDLMARDYRPGDRSRREDDRYLFLEALLSARERLLVSWVGRSVQDNTARPPSVLVGQLRDHLAAGWRSAEGADLLAQLTVDQPLQPFSPALFPVEDDARLFTYAREWQAVHRSVAPTPPPARLPAVSPTEPLAPAVLGRFLASPPRAFFTGRLQVVLEDEAATAEDLEPFAVEGLGAWQLRRQLADVALAPLPPDAAAARSRLDAGLERLRRSGALPPAAPGEAAAAALAEAVTPLLDGVLEWCEAYPERVSPEAALRFEHAGVVVEAWPEGLRRAADGRTLQLAHSVGRLRIGSRPYWRYDSAAPSWVAHLLACTVVGPVTTVLVAADAALRLDPLTAEAAGEHLRALMEAWLEGQREPLPVTCQSACAWLEALTLERDAQADAASVYAGQGQQSGEVDHSPYLARAFPTAEALLADSRFPALAERLYRPLHAALQTPPEASA